MPSDLDQIVERVLIRMDFQDRMLADIRQDVKDTKEQATRTNGRVTALERFQARLEGAHDALSWRTPLVVGVLCAIAGALASSLL